jgi:hypothetical protein
MPEIEKLWHMFGGNDAIPGYSLSQEEHLLHPVQASALDCMEYADENFSLTRKLSCLAPGFYHVESTWKLIAPKKMEAVLITQVKTTGNLILM